MLMVIVLDLAGWPTFVFFSVLRVQNVGVDGFKSLGLVNEQKYSQSAPILMTIASNDGPQQLGSFGPSPLTRRTGCRRLLMADPATSDWWVAPLLYWGRPPPLSLQLHITESSDKTSTATRGKLTQAWKSFGWQSNLPEAILVTFWQLLAGFF